MFQLLQYVEWCRSVYPYCSKDLDSFIPGTPMFQIVRNLKLLKNPLKDLNRGLFGDVENNSMRAWKHLEYVQEQLRNDPTNADLIGIELLALKDYQELLKACNSFLLQKSKAVWLAKGDNNTRTFYNYMKTRQARNKAFLSFYKKLLGESDAVKQHWEILLSSVTNAEIKEALFSIPNHKAPGPDGFSSAFFKDSWDIIVPDVALLENVSQFWPIPCCNVIYKVISKLLCTRLARILPSIISPNQGGFIKGRNIIENILMLVALNFPPHFIKLIKECVTTASYSLVLNGEPFGFFQGKQGLRQGDPLSPLLFTIAMEYLSRYWLLQLIRDKQSVMVMLRSFATFSEASGLHMNRQKSNIYFTGVQRHDKDYIIGISGCVEGQIPFKYLGVPITAGKLGKRECQALIEKIIERIRSFVARKLSYAGRLILVKSVLTSLFTYWANIFLIPKGVMKKIDSICRNYLWDGTNIYLRAPLVSWEHVCNPQSEGGLGIRYSSTWNMATVGKVVWWLYSKPDSLWVKWVHQIYIKGNYWDSHVPKTHMSGNWKTICKIKEVFKPGYVNGVWLVDKDGYNVSSGYEWLRHKEQKVGWAKLLWTSWAVPKHKFLCWLILRNALNVQEKLYKHGICQDEIWDSFDLCQQAWYLDDGTIVGDTLVVGKVLELIMEDGPCLGLHLNVGKTEPAGLQAKLLCPSGILAPGPTFDSVVRLFNETTGSDLLSNPSKIAAPKLMKKLEDIYFTKVTVTAESAFSLTPRQVALWKSHQGSHTSDWLLAVPISRLG
ncbi:uncharacterized protein LOC141589970 [Silene latifolia]|uniref:uncharacterized protein LOC141589970 n=1 Tax=Silene latifolia TaxID=37657 RepID=UPI003D778DC5